MLRTTPLLRAGRTAARGRTAAAASFQPVCQQQRQAHAISNPTLANIEKRWEAMPPQEQADLWMALRDRMKVDWNEMTLQEKKAGMYMRSFAVVWGSVGIGGLDWQGGYGDCRGRTGFSWSFRDESH